MTDVNQTNHRKNGPNDEMMARRRLLKLGAYVPPAVLGMMIVGGMPTPAQAVVGSCCPAACQPCIDLAAGGETEKGKKGGFEPFSKKECNKKWRKCNRKRRKSKCPPISNPC